MTIIKTVPTGALKDDIDAGRLTVVHVKTATNSDVEIRAVTEERKIKLVVNAARVVHSGDVQQGARVTLAGAAVTHLDIDRVYNRYGHAVVTCNTITVVLQDTGDKITLIKGEQQ